MIYLLYFELHIIYNNSLLSKIYNINIFEYEQFTKIYFIRITHIIFITIVWWIMDKEFTFQKKKILKFNIWINEGS